jgi:hypothetical protein
MEKTTLTLHIDIDTAPSITSALQKMLADGYMRGLLLYEVEQKLRTLTMAAGDGGEAAISITFDAPDTSPAAPAW